MITSKLTRKYIYGSQVNEIKLLVQNHTEDFLYLVSRYLCILYVNSRSYLKFSCDVVEVHIEIKTQEFLNLGIGCSHVIFINVLLY